jgi:hypothetical protein
VAVAKHIYWIGTQGYNSSLAVHPFLFPVILLIVSPKKLHLALAAYAAQYAKTQEKSLEQAMTSKQNNDG